MLIANIKFGVSVLKTDGSSYSCVRIEEVISLRLTMSMNLFVKITPKKMIKAIETMAPVYVLKSFYDLYRRAMLGANKSNSCIPSSSFSPNFFI
jgi:hypothetical protein